MSKGKDNVDARFQGNCSRFVFMDAYTFAPLLKLLGGDGTNYYVPAAVAKL
ncbi:MAG TPA: hypothetical protein VN884_03660 [Candidatus Sulfotelmatobacter sp.]|nr:hypothetical protein [Candidatus Sulfotelmatobacter sp.]